MPYRDPRKCQSTTLTMGVRSSRRTELSPVARRYAATTSNHQRVASTVLYSGRPPSSGNLFGSIPWLT